MKGIVIGVVMFAVMARFNNEVVSLALLTFMGSAGLIALFKRLYEKGG